VRNKGGVIRIRLLASALLAAAAVGCVGPRAVGPHPEPELVVEGPSVEKPATDGPVARHKVSAGENLYRIALQYGLTADELAMANGISDARSLAVGQELIIPVSAAEPSESAPPRAPPVPEEKKLAVGKGDGSLSWPVRGVLYARFGRKGREPHDGIDLAAPLGTPVQTAAQGTVLFAGEQRGYGLLAIVEHPEGLVTLYAHNRDLRVKQGQKVRPGQVIATVGESGRTSGPHLHFEVRRSGKPVDPLEHLGPPPGR
jgi:lipoprotein NlpD